MKTLILKKTRAYYRESHWPDNDFVVLDTGKVVGRIMRHPQTPKEQPWFWSITAREYPPSVYGRGYSANREQAMVEFKAQWLRQ